MTCTVAIIGSFQKYYSEILNVIKIFKQFNLHILSPKESYICDKINDFVIFDSDRKDYTPAEIQMVTLDKIVRADVVYVYNPKGYVGKTTCYEIGFCFSKKKPIFFLNEPIDLPIPVIKNEQILAPRAFANYICNNKPEFILNYKLCNEAQKSLYNLLDIEKDIKSIKSKKIIICGSMMFYNEMLKCQKQLEEWEIEAIVPKEEENIINNFNEKQFLEFKKKVSRAYLKKIRDKETAGVLIYNAEKNGIPNYIGANTLVELAMAFTWNRKIFLFHDIYLPLKDELQAWDCICLNGNLEYLKDLFTNKNLATEKSKYVQLSLFD